MDFSEEVVEKIVSDLADRSGLGNEWDAIDELTKSEIKSKWRFIIQSQLVRHEREIKVSFGVQLPKP